MDGSFYKPALQKVQVSKNKRYRIETVLQLRRVGKRTGVLVKWYGYPQSFDSWIDSKHLFGTKQSDTALMLNRCRELYKR